MELLPVFLPVMGLYYQWMCHFQSISSSFSFPLRTLSNFWSLYTMVLWHHWVIYIKWPTLEISDNLLLSSRISYLRSHAVSMKLLQAKINCWLQFSIIKIWIKPKTIFILKKNHCTRILNTHSIINSLIIAKLYRQIRLW